MIAFHASNVISDSSGQLLFYTQRLYMLYNRLHQIMQNGYGLHGGEVLENVVSVPLPEAVLCFISLLMAG